MEFRGESPGSGGNCPFWVSFVELGSEPLGMGRNRPFWGCFPRTQQRDFFQTSTYQPFGISSTGTGGRFDHFGLVSPNSEASSRASWRRDAAPPAAGCCTFKKCKRFRAGPHPFPHHPAGRDFWGFTTPGQIFGVLARKPHSGEQGGVTVEDLGRSLGACSKGPGCREVSRGSEQ